MEPLRHRHLPLPDRLHARTQYQPRLSHLAAGISPNNVAVIANLPAQLLPSEALARGVWKATSLHTQIPGMAILRPNYVEIQTVTKKV